MSRTKRARPDCRSGAFIDVLLRLSIVSYSLALAYALSISSNTNSSKNGIKAILTSQQSLAPASSSNLYQPQQSMTTLPPLITTLSQMNYIDSIMDQSQQQQQHQSAGKQYIQDDMQQFSERRLGSDMEHGMDESIPLATINNHNRNNNQQSIAAARPPQYVDVAALVGRDRNSNNLTGNLMLASPNTTGNGISSGLSPKSRSGLPECATQQVCNAIFVRMNYTQKLCECSSNYNWRCSNNQDPQDGHTIELTRKFDKRIYTQIKTCEPLREVRACKSPTDWTLLALQSERSGKAHYVVVCKCPTWAQLEGPYTHNHPPYANIPGIRVYGMLCAHQTARSSAQTYSTYNPALNTYPEFPWSEALSVLNTTSLQSTLDSH